MYRRLILAILLVTLALPQTGCVIIGTIVVKKIINHNRAEALKNELGVEVEKKAEPTECVKEEPKKEIVKEEIHKPEPVVERKTVVNRAF